MASLARSRTKLYAEADDQKKLQEFKVSQLSSLHNQFSISSREELKVIMLSVWKLLLLVAVLVSSTVNAYDDYGGEDSLASPGSTTDRIKSFTTTEELQKILNEEEGNQDPLIVGYFDPSTNSEDQEIFKELAKDDGYDYRFAMTTEKSMLEELKFDGCAVVVYKPPKFLSKNEKPKARFPSKKLKKDALKKFYQSKSLPLVALKGYSAYSRYKDIKVPVVTVFADADLKKNPKGYQYLANRVGKVATEYVGKAVFVIANKEDQRYTFDDYGLPKLEGKKEIGVGLKHGDLYYKMDQTTFSVENLKNFMTAYFAGTLIPKEKKEYKPPSEDEEDDVNSNVVTLTNDNFPSIVTDSNNDAMVEFYAPWCGHCKSLKPVYKEVADEFRDDPAITIGAMDATANTPPSSFEVQGYPTLYFVPGDKSKKPVVYDGDRSKEAIVDYIKKHRTTQAP